MNKLLGIILAAVVLLGGVANAQDQLAPIRVGLTTSLTGRHQAAGREQLQGVQLWVESVNARGALLGRKVELVFADDQSDPATAAQLYQSMLAGRQVDLLLGPYSSDITLAASAVAARYGMPMLAIGASASDIWQRGYRNTFGMDSPAANYFDLALQFAHDAGISKVALLNADTGFAREVARGVQDKAPGMGMTVVLAQEYAADETGFAGLVQRVGSSGAEVLLAASYLKDSVALVKELHRQRTPLRAVVFTVGPGMVEFGEQLGEQANGVLGVVQWLRSSRMPGAQDFSWRYNERFGYQAGVHAAMGYSAGQALEAAVRLAGSTEGWAVSKQLANMKFRSLVGHYQVDANGMQTAKKTYLMQWQDGRRVLVLPSAQAEAPVRPFQPWR